MGARTLREGSDIERAKNSSTGITTPPDDELAGEKPAAAWSPEQLAEFMLESLAKGDFYILCPDGETTRDLDEKRMAWAMGDIIENRPPLSRWHPDHGEAFKAFLAEG